MRACVLCVCVCVTASTRINPSPIVYMTCPKLRAQITLHVSYYSTKYIVLYTTFVKWIKDEVNEEAKGGFFPLRGQPSVTSPPTLSHSGPHCIIYHRSYCAP